MAAENKQKTIRESHELRGHDRRAADEGGSAFWRAALDSGSVGRATFILEVLKGAKAAPPTNADQAFIDLQTADQQYLAAKTDIGAYFAIHNGMSNVENANAVMQLFSRDTLSEPLASSAAVTEINALAEVALDDTFGDFLIQVQGIVDIPFDL